MRYPKKPKPRKLQTICPKCSAQLMDFDLVLGDGLHCRTCQPKIYILKSAKTKANEE